MSWPASGAAVTFVPALALGGGVGLLVRNRGWIWSSLDGGLEREPGLECDMVPERDTGPERVPGLGKLCCRIGLLSGGVDGGGNIAAKLGKPSGLDGGEFGRETDGCGLGGGVSDGLD